MTKFKRTVVTAAMLALGASATWAGYAPAAVMQPFEKETGQKVDLTLSNNKKVISKLPATGGTGSDLAQPSQEIVASGRAKNRG